MAPDYRPKIRESITFISASLYNGCQYFCFFTVLVGSNQLLDLVLAGLSSLFAALSKMSLHNQNNGGPLMALPIYTVLPYCVIYGIWTSKIICYSTCNGRAWR